MKVLKTIVIAWLLASSVRADEILVITGINTSIKAVSSKQIKNIFLRKTLLNEDGSSWIPLNLSLEDPLRRAFSQSLFGQTPDEMETYWNEQYFHGIAPPYVVQSEEAMLRLVADSQGAIGYILPCHLDKRVKVIYRLAISEPLNKGCNK